MKSELIEEAGWRSALFFGAMLGLGYLSKPVMFPLGLIFLGSSALFLKPRPRALCLTGIAALAFLAVASVYIVPLSLVKGRPTFSDSGRLAYAWEVNRIAPYIDWQGQPPEFGTPKHPTRQILNFPPTYEFDGRPGTYPPWYDASYWNDGLRPKLRVSDQLRRLMASASFYADFAWREPVPVLLLFSLVVGLVLTDRRRYWCNLVRLSALIVPCLAVFILYALVFVLARYLAVFALVLLLLGLAAWLGTPRLRTETERAWLNVLSGVILLAVIFHCAASIGRGIFRERSTSHVVHERVAAELNKLGVGPGDNLAVIGRGLDGYFARLLGAKIVAEAPVLTGHPSWLPTSENLDRITDAFQERSSAKAVVTDVPVPEGSRKWKKVSGTHYSVRLLDRPGVPR